MKTQDIDETLHVYEAHTFNFLSLIEGEEDEYTREELLKEIAEMRENFTEFRDKWLIPILDEVDSLRANRMNQYDLEYQNLRKIWRCPASAGSPTDTEILDWLDKNTRYDYPFDGWMQELHFGKDDHCNTLREWAIYSIENTE